MIRGKINNKSSLNGKTAIPKIMKGIDGESAYEVAVNNGFIGTEEEWLASLKGEKGDTGERGEKGEKGDTPDMTNYYNKTEINSMIGDIESVLNEVV